MKTYARVIALLLTLILAVALFACCDKNSTSDAPAAESSPSATPTAIPTPSTTVSEEQPAPQLSVGDQGSMPVFEW